jgi:heme/copper-type cytochrome/quinol oxidase subunit 2
VGGLRTVRVRENQRIRLVVTSDVSDHVHLHGYDLMVDVAPGRPGRLTLRATVPGRFEVELEDRRLQILELEVRP